MPKRPFQFVVSHVATSKPGNKEVVDSHITASSFERHPWFAGAFCKHKVSVARTAGVFKNQYCVGAMGVYMARTALLISLMVAPAGAEHSYKNSGIPLRTEAETKTFQWKPPHLTPPPSPPPLPSFSPLPPFSPPPPPHRRLQLPVVLSPPPPPPPPPPVVPSPPPPPGACTGLLGCIVQGAYQTIITTLDFFQSLVNIKLNFWYQVCSIFFTTGCINYAPPTVFG
eukprot:jgi/Botrbrau1/1390/Bobra.0063s0090.1